MAKKDVKEQETEEGSSSEKASSAPRRRKSTKVKAAEGTQAALDETASDADGADAPAEKATRKRMSKSKKAASAKDKVSENVESDENSADDMPDEATPKGKKKAVSGSRAKAAKKSSKTNAKRNAEEDAEKGVEESAHATDANSASLSEARTVAVQAVSNTEMSAESSMEATGKEVVEASAETVEAPSGKTSSRSRRSRRVVTLETPLPDKDSQEASGETDDSADKDDQVRTTRRAQQNQGKAASSKGQYNQGRQNSNGKVANAHDKHSAQNDKNARNNANNNNANNNNANNNGRKQRRQFNNQQREIAPSVTLEDITKLKVGELRTKAAELAIDTTGLKKAELVEAVYEASVRAEGFKDVAGVLDILPDGYGFLRTQGYLPSETDAYVGLSTIRRNGLRKGDYVCGQTRPTREGEKYAAIQKVVSVNGLNPELCRMRPKFADLTPVYPDDRLWMEHGKTTMTARVVDLVAPIGKGQRGLIVSPPKAGKTTILKDIAASIAANNPEVHLMCLLVDERPEEVTDMQRSVHGEVISSTFDMPCENHIAVAELVIERAKRLVEQGEDVVILMDSITRLARAYNLAQPASGRILSGGVDSTALYPPKRFLGAARNIEGGGSLTILASALIDTGSKMDEVIFEEFKGTGNMELRLDRNLADRRIFPAIDPVASGTRKEELLLDTQEAPLIWAVRRILANLNNTERAMDMLIKSLKQTETNQEFLIRTAKKAQHGKSGETIEL